MSLTEEQIAGVFELLKLASPEQRQDFLARLRFMEFNDKQEIYVVNWTDGGTGGEPPKELIQALEAIKGPVPVVHPDELR